MTYSISAFRFTQPLFFCARQLHLVILFDLLFQGESHKIYSFSLKQALKKRLLACFFLISKLLQMH
ncbi:hypothetical protein DBB36_09715 [Flavobacterium sp. WLB]|nr:hypothetical protein AKO67_04720 [Flavobacterium sp. VMW]OWU91681.1 hypothetical protein APR43_06245 [Flavobacterium sp. NLM]PUU70190.1 hypothetical protein DBB36_09715 [Flavobacterium sp. WLB]